jgi:hypothetical protein
MTIQTSAEWWRLIEQNWDELMALLERYGLANDRAGMERLKARRDARIARRLQAAKPYAPGRRQDRLGHDWRVLFDLCAEQWVLYQALA